VILLEGVALQFERLCARGEPPAHGRDQMAMVLLDQVEFGERAFTIALGCPTRDTHDGQLGLLLSDRLAKGLEG
jgi:hypothetical protein